MAKHPPLDYNEIVKGIYVGTNQCCQVHFDERLIERGIEADISLEQERLDAPFGVKFYFWLPVKDHHAPTQDQLKVGVTMLEALVRLGKQVYVHCKNGHGRAPTLVAAYLIKRGKTFAEAEKLIKMKRPEVHIEPSQREALKRFAEKLH